MAQLIPSAYKTRYVIMRIKLLSLFLLQSVISFAQVASDGEFSFAGLQRNFAGINLNYRKANIEGQAGDAKALVIYLHGGSSCGTDNTTQMSEPGIDSIANYLFNHHKAAVFIVPQCPDRNKGWGGITKNVKALLDFTANTEGVDPSQIYIFGGSMGGTGTWKMLSSYPDYFAAAMPCAANPKGMNAETVATTPVYNVMGLADKIMNSDVRSIAEDFISQLQQLGDEAVYETVPDWTHEVTCVQSYSKSRMDWVFAHTKHDTSSILTQYNEQRKTDDAWYTLSGVRIAKPSSPGLYIHGGKIMVGGVNTPFSLK